MFVFGIDPGLSGGVSFYDGEAHELHVFPMPTYEVEFMKNRKKQKRKETDIPALCQLFRDYQPTSGIVEKVTARPGQGVTSMFRFGQNLGQIEGVLVALDIPFEFVMPQAWKKFYDLTSDKDASLMLADQTFEGHGKTFKLKKNDGLAESALIARFEYVRKSQQ
jgi:crossover junction endodeoxyribonuclease RuvC